MSILFQCDYNEGAHPLIMKRLLETNLEQTVGYGEDAYCRKAAAKVRKACEDDTLAVHFLVGGTQTNMTVIDCALRSYQGVLCADTGHINVHETGAVESLGHKVLALPGQDGKITAGQVEEAYLAHVHNGSFEHMVQPKMVYLSNPTELGTIYYKEELQELYRVCREHGLYLFMDGARLGYGLAAPDNDLSLPDIARYTDVFYIGGTKVGALFGEAVVISNEELKKDFRYFIKQKGGMLAKGRLLGIQFDTLFTDDLYLEISRHAIGLAEKLREVFVKKGYELIAPNRTNQIFVKMPNAHLDALAPEFGFSYDHPVDEVYSVVRFCTSWATNAENVDRLAEAINNLNNLNNFEKNT